MKNPLLYNDCPLSSHVQKVLRSHPFNFDPVYLTRISTRNNLDNLIPRKRHERNFLFISSPQKEITYLSTILNKISAQNPQYTLMRNDQ